MVVPVLMTSCHVSENLNIGPVIPHSNIIAQAKMNAAGFPEAFVMLVAILSKNKENRFFFLFYFPLYLFL